MFGLSVRQLANRLKATVAVGLEEQVSPGQYGSVGPTQMMIGTEPPVETTMQQVRWKIAVMVSRYTRKETDGAALRWMDGETQPLVPCHATA